MAGGEGEQGVRLTRFGRQERKEGSYPLLSYPGSSVGRPGEKPWGMSVFMILQVTHAPPHAAAPDTRGTGQHAVAHDTRGKARGA